MPTVRSWTDAEAVRAVRDTGALLRFRLAGRSRRRPALAVGVLVAATLAAAAVPALLPEQALSRDEAARAMPAVYLSLLLVAVLSAVSSGGGRELLARDQAVALPVSPATDHLGALLLAPLNIAWLTQAWALLAGTSYVVGAGPRLPAALLVPTAWLVVATAAAQAVAWAVEWLGRGPHGTLLVRLTGGLVVAAAAGPVLTGTAGAVLGHSPAIAVARAASRGGGRAWLTVAVLAALAAVLVPAGAALAARAARRAARAELRAETAVHPARANPVTDLAALVRVDRAGIWRSVPMRRGAFVLAAFPGLVALVGSFAWQSLAIVPGLVASGGALLFGVNAWCLDGRGALWRDSLPVPPRTVLASRALVLTEILLASSLFTLGLAALRAGRPAPGQLVAVLGAVLVVSVQVVATALRWSVRHPFPVDLRSARATPAPPLAMVGYSARLAVTTTLTCLSFELVGALAWWWTPVLATPYLAWSLAKLARTSSAWSDPVTRSRVVATVAG